MTERPQGTAEASVAVIDEPALSPGGMLDVRIAARVCPYLLAADGDWRSAMPTKEHRCTALEPPAYLSLDKQRRLCLTASHLTCATYVAARRAQTPPDRSRAGDPEVVTDEVEGVATTDDGGGAAAVRWPIPRTAPVILDRGRPSLRSLLGDRSVAQLGLALLMVLAFVVLALARLSAAETVPGQTVASPSPAASAPPAGSTSPALSPAASASAAASAVPPPSAAASVAPASPPASTAPVARVYRVVSGDTLSGIAARFGVSVTALQRANGIQDPSLLRIGQLLIIP